MKEYNLILDQAVLDEYTAFYFSQHPKAHKIPIEHPWHPSVNQWFILQRMSMNALKQKWKDFGVWWVNKLGLSSLKLDNYSMEFTVYFPTKARHDPDNQTPKFLMDAFTEAGLIVDDDDKHMHELVLRCRYDKEHPRTEIKIIKEN